MTEKEKWEILLDGLNLKVGDEIVITDCYKYFSNSVKKNRYVRFTYVPHIYKVAEEERNYYLVERHKGSYQDSGGMFGAFSHSIYKILNNDFDKIEDAKYLKQTTIIYPSRADYYRAHPEQNIWKYDNPDYPGNEDKLQTYYEVAKNKTWVSCWNSFEKNKTETLEDEVVIRMKDKEAFIKRVNNLHLNGRDSIIRTVQTIADLK